MKASLVMTIIGVDHPGLVGRLSALIAEHGGNWLESRMVHIGDQFAGTLHIEIPTEEEPGLLTALLSLEPQSLSVSVQRDATIPAPVAHKLATIKVIGHDQPGIVRQISEVLARHQVNIEELTSDCQSAATSGETLFRATAKVRLPESCGLDLLRHELGQIGTDLMVDITVRPVKAS